MDNILSVSALNLYAKNILENDRFLKDIAVEAEISNFKNHYTSGHFYFSLKDEKAAISAVMFKFNNIKMNFMPKDGMKVLVRGKVSIYEANGSYQFYVTDMFPAGIGARQIAFEQLKQKLEKEGLFSQINKKPLPQYPFKIGVATSQTGAAIKDIVSVANRRFPCAQIYLANCLVQGEKQAEKSIIKAIQTLDEIEDLDLIIITRGGGSADDLWIYNSEEIARAAFSCKKPTISAIGHEIDYTILDFVCDVRAATPSAAAELALPDRESLIMNLLGYEEFFKDKLASKAFELNRNLEIIKSSDGFYKFKNFKSLNSEKLINIQNNLNQNIKFKVETLKSTLAFNHKMLDELNPLNLLKKGYNLVYKEDDLIKNKELSVGDELKIITENSDIYCDIKKIDIKKDIY